jgi:hypothetical protein
LVGRKGRGPPPLTAAELYAKQNAPRDITESTLLRIISIAYSDRLCCARHRLKSRAAESIHRLAGNLNWESSNQECHARNVAVVFTRLVRAPENDVVNDRRINSTSCNDRLKDGGGEVVRAHSCERAAVTTDGGANRLNDPRLAEWSSRRY